MAPDNARLFLYEDNDGLHAVRFGANVPLRLPIGATPLGEVVTLRPTPRRIAWAVQNMDGAYLSCSGWSLDGDILLFESEAVAAEVQEAVLAVRPHSNVLVAKVYGDSLDVVEGGNAS